MFNVTVTAFSALTLLVGRHPACKKTEWWGASMVICLERGADFHTAQLIPLPLTVSCFSKIQCVCVRACVCVTVTAKSTFFRPNVGEKNSLVSVKY